MPTPQETIKTLTAALSKIITTMIAEDAKDPGFWAEAGIDLDKFTEGLERHGAHLSVAFLFSQLQDDTGKVIEPLSVGLGGGDPEHLMAGIEIEPDLFKG
jgi:hypothetical protein